MIYPLSYKPSPLPRRLLAEKKFRPAIKMDKHSIRKGQSNIAKKKDITIQNALSLRKGYREKQKMSLLTIVSTIGNLKQEDTVAAHLRSLRSDDPLNKGHPRSI